MSARRALELLYIDMWDALRPPAFDILLLVVGIMAGALSVIIPITSPIGALNPNNAFNPVMIGLAVATIYMALRSAADLVNVIQGGLFQVYMSYPISRLQVALTLYVARVIMPALILLGLPALVIGFMLYPVVLKNPLDFVALWLSYFVQSQMYGVIFLLLSSRFRAQGVAMVASVSFYFAYVALSFFLYLLGLFDDIKTLQQLSNAMGFYTVIYDFLAKVSTPTWEAAVVPAVFIVLLGSYLAYMSRRFEPT